MNDHTEELQRFHRHEVKGGEDITPHIRNTLAVLDLLYKTSYNHLSYRCFFSVQMFREFNSTMHHELHSTKHIVLNPRTHNLIENTPDPLVYIHD